MNVVIYGGYASTIQQIKDFSLVQSGQIILNQLDYLCMASINVSSYILKLNN